MSIIRCQRAARKIEDRAHTAYDVSYHLTPGWDDVPDRCYIDIRNKSIAGIASLEGLKEWEIAVLSHGSISLDRDMFGQVPTVDEKAMVGRIEACSGEIIGIHSERTLTGKETGGPLSRVAHVHFRADPRSARCLIRKLLEEP